MTIGERIKNRRTQLGLSADDVAEAIGKARATYYRYENGDIDSMPLKTLEPLALALKTTPAFLMGRTENPDEGYEAWSGNKPIKIPNKDLQNLISTISTFNREDIKTLQCLTIIHKLNEKGKAEAVKRVQELTYIPEYAIEELLPVAAHDDHTGTEAERKESRDIMTDDNEWR